MTAEQMMHYETRSAVWSRAYAAALNAVLQAKPGFTATEAHEYATRRADLALVAYDERKF